MPVRPSASEYVYSRHSLAVRILHWINVAALTILLMSGLQIFNAHPALYWGLSSYNGKPPFFVLPHGFPGWITLPGVQWLSMGRRLHFFFAWIFVINGLYYVESIWQHLRLRHPQGEAARRYNILQKLSYLFVIFGLLPFVILMGWAMSPRLDTVIPGWVDIVGGRQSARSLHFIAAWTIVAFVLVHVFEVIITGVVNNLRSMITGRYSIKAERVDDRH